MEFIKYKKSIENQIIDTVVDYLINGKIVVMPTDTVYGLHAVIDNKEAVRRINQIKGRNLDQPLISLVCCAQMALKYAQVDKEQQKTLNELWGEKESPTTVILEKKGDLADNVAGKDGSISVRLPNDEFLIKIIERIKKPLFSTSLNKSGRNTIKDPEKIKDQFDSVDIDLIVSKGKIEGEPSKIVDLRDPSDVKVLRD